MLKNPVLMQQHRAAHPYSCNQQCAARDQSEIINKVTLHLQPHVLYAMSRGAHLLLLNSQLPKAPFSWPTGHGKPSLKFLISLFITPYLCAHVLEKSKNSIHILENMFHFENTLILCILLLVSALCTYELSCSCPLLVMESCHEST